MELRNAIAVCLITLFCATLVLLMARWLDLQAASRLEPQLARIVEELEAIRKSGGMALGSGVAAENESPDDALMVYYFHGNVRCATCTSIESQTRDAVESTFASQLESGEVVWKILNYEKPEGEELGKRFDVLMPVVVLARMKGGQIDDWKRLDEVWALVGNSSAFSQFIEQEIGRMLEPEQAEATPADGSTEATVADSAPPELPGPESVDESNPLRAPVSADLPIPADGASLPVPQ